jgi:hypothetical protein
MLASSHKSQAGSHGAIEAVSALAEAEDVDVETSE